MRSQKVVKLPGRVMTAFEMQRRPAAFQRQALKEPVTITSNGEPTLVVMSVEEYQRLRDTPRSIGPAESGVAGYPPVMNRQEAIERLHAHRADLEKLGAAHVALFGSLARDEAHEGSDVDIIVDTADGSALGLFRLGDIKEKLELILGRDIDVFSRRGLSHAQTMKQRIAADMLDVF
jgi:predicted nucleotidyltransferase